MARRPRRWAPRGGGWRCVFDGGGEAVWMRREPDGTVTASVYVDLNPGDRRNGIWTFNAPCGAGVLWWVFEKPYQVLTLVFLEPPYGPGCGRPGGYQPLPQGPRRRAPRVRSASRAAKALGAGQRLPRKFSRR